MFAIAAAQAKANAEAVKRFGMHYQWGRKDPFTPSITADKWGNGTEVQIYNADGTAITKGTYSTGAPDGAFEFDNTITTTINDLIQNPSTHYNQGDGTDYIPIANTEYYNTTKEGSWWNPTIKTIYDPCPNGYRIPKNGTYNGLTTTTFPWTGSGLTAGRVWTSVSSFFPTSGSRNAGSGQFAAVGTEGFSWMSLPPQYYSGCHLYFTSKAVSLSSNYSRAHGMSTRCIKE